MSAKGQPTKPDARLHAVLSRLRSDSPGERLAALAALERMLPAGTSLHEVIQVGLFYTDRGSVAPSLVEEVDRLRGALLDAERREDRLRRRTDALEAAARDVVREAKRRKG
ncbi:hypothetical protein [Azospirillum rugosum]|uniref:Uncharacterized protein n=1 Tax=Azospirillum rugosum TaxID=416170 RepID=A0ABS4SCL1_9PROT|nr:hypothetical protein [Azospirillum rugosum]MBP2290295.1 hypothetical protein [Azospirillum rugosum]MDQ0527771.1 hypothetical protein [Azospirillum rugosum]